MRSFKTFAACVLAVGLHHGAWAQIYETTDAQGNPDFTDSPASSDAEKIDLPETNLVNPPPPDQQAQRQASPETVEQAPAQGNRPVIIHDGGGNENYDDGVYVDEVARQRELDRRARAESGESVDPGYEMPDEVGDSNSQIPHEVGDSNSQMPDEVGDSDSQMPDEVGDSNSQMPHEVGDFPNTNGARRR